MQLKPATQAALDGWVGPQTWDSGHPADMERFYRFVGQYQRDHGLSINESDLRDEDQGKGNSKGSPGGSSSRKSHS